ncbi:MAG: hypothetical protein ACRCT8_14220 [Lacipirellulaceae bacterium]
MSRETAQLANLLQTLLRTSRGRARWTTILLLGVALALYALVIQPMAVKRGIPLPPLVADGGAPAPRVDQSDREPSAPRPPAPQRRASATDSADGDAIDAVLARGARGPFDSPGGLRYTRGSQHGHRLAHLMAHTRDEPNRAGQHGVFDDDEPTKVVALVDEAYAQALSGRQTRTEREGERTVYTVNLGRRVGYIGGDSGNRRGMPAANHLRLVVESNRLITAFPVRP